jgi:hypothetical protein
MTMMRRFLAISMSTLVLCGSYANAQESAKVQITATIPATVASFTDQRLVISLAHNFPQQDDRGDRTVDRHIDAKFSHEKGKATLVTIHLGEKVKLNPGVQYFVTLSVFTRDSKSTHIAKMNGEEGPFPVLTNGSPSKVTLIVSPVP